MSSVTIREGARETVAAGRYFEHRDPESGRLAIAYVPRGTRASTSGVIVVPSSGVTIEQAMARSGWCQIADEEPHKDKFIVVFCDSAPGWMPEGPQANLGYLHEVLMFAESRWDFCIHESKRYLVGYGDGGTIATLAAASDPASWAGLVVLDAPAVPGGLTRIESQQCINLQGFDNDGSMDLVKGDVGLPFWSLGGDDNDLNNWLVRNGCGDAPVRIDEETVEYRRDEPVRSVLNEDAGAFVVRRTPTRGYSANEGHDVNTRLWTSFLSRQRRWMSLPGGDLRIATDPVEDLGMEYHLEDVDGFQREWYVHVPENVRESGRLASLVVALHGYTCSGEIYVGSSGWSRAADEQGFIVIFPTAMPGNLIMENEAIQPDFHPMPAWNIGGNVPDGPDDVAFIEEVITRTSRSWPIDESRIYATGHSWGSVMTHLLAAALPERFAAVAPCSGVCFGGYLKDVMARAADDPVPVPIWMLWGTNEGWLIQPWPKDGTESAQTIRFWTRRNCVDAPEDLISPMSPADVDVIGRTWWQNEFGEHVPLVRYTAVDGMAHATMPSMSGRIWTDFFARLRKGKDGRGLLC